MSQNENNGFVNHSLRMTDSANMNDEYDNDNNDFDQPENLDALQTYIMPEVTTNPQGGQQPQGNQQNEVLPNRDLERTAPYMDQILQRPFDIAETVDVFQGNTLKVVNGFYYLKIMFNSFLSRCDTTTVTEVDNNLQILEEQQRSNYAKIVSSKVVKCLDSTEIFDIMDVIRNLLNYLYIPCMTYLTSGNVESFKTDTYKSFVNYIVALMQQYYTIYKPIGDSNFAFWWYAFCYPIVYQLLVNDVAVIASIRETPDANRQDQPSPNGGANTQHPQQVGNTSNEMDYNPDPTV